MIACLCGGAIEFAVMAVVMLVSFATGKLAQCCHRRCCCTKSGNRI